MPWNQFLARQVVQFMNELNRLDPEAVRALVEARVPCSETLADHPTVQVSVGEEGQAQVGLLGVLNGMCGVDEDGWGPIVAVFEEDGTLSKFELSDSPTIQRL